MKSLKKKDHLALPAKALKTQTAILSKQTHLHEEVAKLIEQVEKTLAKEAVSSTFTTPLRAFGEMGGAGAGGPAVEPEVD